jgi:hypothetical protein
MASRARPLARKNASDTTTLLVERAAERRDAHGLVHGRAEHCEVQARLAADIAVEHLAGVEREIGARRGQAPRPTIGAERVGRAASRVPGAQRGGAGVGGVGPLERRQDAVAHELQDLPALGLDGVDLRLGIGVEQVEQLLPRQTVGQAREVFQVAVPDDRVDGQGMAALDGAVQHAGGRVGAEIGREQRARRRRLQRAGEDEAGQKLVLQQDAQLRLVEAARPIGGPGRVDGARLAEGQGLGHRRAQGDVVGRAVRCEVGDHAPFVGSLARLEAAAQHVLPRDEEFVERALAPALRAARDRPRRVVDRDAGVAPPDHQRRVELRVHEQGADRCARQGHAGLQQRRAVRLDKTAQILPVDGRPDQGRGYARAGVRHKG